MAATPKWLGCITEDILIHCIIPNILPASKFYTEELHRAFQQHLSDPIFSFFYLSAFGLSPSQFPVLGLQSNLSSLHRASCLSAHTMRTPVPVTAAPWPLSAWIYLYGAKERSGNKCNSLKRWQYNFSPITRQYAITRSGGQEMLRAEFTLWILQPGVSWMKDIGQHCLLERTVRQRYCQSIWMLPAALSLFEH